jgi:hypothetical protein
MADLLTHYVSARLPGGFVADPAARTTLILGVFLPDIAGKGIEAIPNVWDNMHVPAHTPLGLAVLCYALAMLFVESFRFKAFVTLYAGSLIHVIVDMTKDNLGGGSSRLLYPLSLDGYEFGLYYNENILWFLPGNVLLLFLIRRAARRAQKAGWVWK